LGYNEGRKVGESCNRVTQDTGSETKGKGKEGRLGNRTIRKAHNGKRAMDAGKVQDRNFKQME